MKPKDLGNYLKNGGFWVTTIRLKRNDGKFRALHMKEHPDYKYRPRRKPKSGMTNNKTKEPARYSFPADTTSHRHHQQHQMSHHLPTHHHMQSNSAVTLPSFNRSLFSSPDLVAGSVPAPPSAPSSSASSGSTSGAVADKSASERAEFNYSRMLFASQLPSLHLGFATLGHPALHAATAVQIPWYHYSMDSSVFNPLTHPASAGLQHRSASHQHLQHHHQQQMATLDSQLVAHRKMMRSIHESVSKKSPLPEDRASPLSNNNSSSRPISAASSYDSECPIPTAPSAASATVGVSSTPPPTLSSATSSSMLLPPPPPSMAAVAAAAAAGLFPFHYGAAAAAAAASYPHHPATTSAHLGCSCSPLCVTMNHHQQTQQHEQRGLISAASPLPTPRQHRCSLSTVL